MLISGAKLLIKMTSSFRDKRVKTDAGSRSVCREECGAETNGDNTVVIGPNTFHVFEKKQPR